MPKFTDPSYTAGYEAAYKRNMEMRGYAAGSRAVSEMKDQLLAAEKRVPAFTDRHTLRSVSDQGKTRAFRFAAKSVQPQTSDAKFKAALAQLQMVRVKMATAARNPITQGRRLQQSVLEDLSTGLHHGNRR